MTFPKMTDRLTPEDEAECAKIASYARSRGNLAVRYEVLTVNLLNEVSALRGELARLREAPFCGDKIQRPHLYIQWKGTEVCCDVYCECGAQGHIDDEFMYAVRCPVCGALYQVGDMMALRRIESWDGCTPRTWNEFEPGLAVSIAVPGAAGVVGIRRCVVEFQDPVRVGYYVVRALDGSDEQFSVSVEELRKTRRP